MTAGRTSRSAFRTQPSAAARPEPPVPETVSGHRALRGVHHRPAAQDPLRAGRPDRPAAHRRRSPAVPLRGRPAADAAAAAVGRGPGHQPAPAGRGYIFDLTDAGPRPGPRGARQRASTSGPRRYRWRSTAAGWRRRPSGNAHVTRRRGARRASSGWCSTTECIDMLGPAINSAKSLFLYGDAGQRQDRHRRDHLAACWAGDIFVPYAVEVDGQIMVRVRPGVPPRRSRAATRRRPEPTRSRSGSGRPPSYDRRYVRVQRPVVLTGGELTLDQLDLQYDYHTKMYQAPFQVKANGGVLIVDDFGRQRVPPRDLLNRWIVPLEKRIDFLTLHTGGSSRCPFDCLLIFATNLEPTRAGRGGVPPPHPLQDPGRRARPASSTPRSSQRCCDAAGHRVRPRGGAAHLPASTTGAMRSRRAACHPRDILDHLVRHRPVPRRRAGPRPTTRGPGLPLLLPGRRRGTRDHGTSRADTDGWPQLRAEAALARRGCDRAGAGQPPAAAATARRCWSSSPCCSASAPRWSGTPAKSAFPARCPTVTEPSSSSCATTRAPSRGAWGVSDDGSVRLAAAATRRAGSGVRLSLLRDGSAGLTLRRHRPTGSSRVLGLLPDHTTIWC